MSTRQKYLNYFVLFEGALGNLAMHSGELVSDLIKQKAIIRYALTFHLVYYNVSCQAPVRCLSILGQPS